MNKPRRTPIALRYSNFIRLLRWNSAVKSWLTQREGEVSVLDHVLNSSFHRDGKEGQEIDE